MKYIERLQSDQKESKELQFLAKRTKLQLEADILETQSALATYENGKEEILNSKNIDFEELVDLDNKIEALKEGLSRLVGYKKELF